VEDVSEDIRDLETRLAAMEDLCSRVDAMEELIAGVASSVGVLLMQDEQSFWEE
jgi:hypothetical protein